jgi:hypothetical protein
MTTSYSVKNKKTISSHGEQSNMSSHEYVWWLVLWIAFKWHSPGQTPSNSSTTNNEDKDNYEDEDEDEDQDEDTDEDEDEGEDEDEDDFDSPNQFVNDLFSSDTYASFTALMSERWHVIQQTHGSNRFNDESIGTTMAILATLFDDTVQKQLALQNQHSIITSITAKWVDER